MHPTKCLYKVKKDGKAYRCYCNEFKPFYPFIVVFKNSLQQWFVLPQENRGDTWRIVGEFPFNGYTDWVIVFSAQADGMYHFAFQGGKRFVTDSEIKDAEIKVLEWEERELKVKATTDFNAIDAIKMLEEADPLELIAKRDHGLW